MTHIVVDAMGGDNAPKAVVEGCLKAIKDFDIKITLVGKEDLIKEHLINYDNDKISIVNADPSFNVSFMNTDYGHLTGSSNTIIKGHNTVGVTINNAAAKKGASITKYYIGNAGTVYNQQTATFYNITDKKITSTVVDSRGNQYSIPFEFDVVDYVNLTCSLDASMEIDENNTEKANLKLTMNGNCFNDSFGVENNTLILTLHIKQDDEDYKSITISVPSSYFSGNTYSRTYTITNMPYQSTYSFYIVANDEVMSVTTPVKTIIAEPVFDWSKDDFNFNVPIHYKGKEIDFVIEEGTKDGWYYRNWKSGRGECWKTVTVNTTITTAWGSLFGGNTKMTRQSYPFQFESKPVEQATLQSSYAATFLIAESSGAGENGGYQSAIYNVVRPAKMETAYDYYISLYACGKLKQS